MRLQVQQKLHQYFPPFNLLRRLKVTQLRILSDFKCAFLRLANHTEGYLNLYQKDHRFFPNSTYEYSLVRIIIMKIDKATKNMTKYINDTMDCDRDASIYVELEPGDYYVIV